MKILIVAAHPDDEVLGAGGTIARHIRNGDQVTIAILGEGITSRYLNRDEANPKLVVDLKTKSRHSSEIMGCKDLKFFDLPDNRFDSINLLDIVKVVEGLVEQTQPGIVYTHHYGDLNIDHMITSRAVLTACRPLPKAVVRRVLAFEVPSATGWGMPEQAFIPNVFIDITETIQTKLAAVKAYSSEVRPFPHPRSPEALMARAQMRGSEAGVLVAEAFVLLRELS